MCPEGKGTAMSEWIYQMMQMIVLKLKKKLMFSL